MTTSVEFKVRPLSDFSETKTADDWIVLYQSTRSVEELLGLLHGGARYAEDPRVLDVYLLYTKFPYTVLGASRFDNHVVVQKARSMLYHHILPGVKNFMAMVETSLDLQGEQRRQLAERLDKIFLALMSPHAFPVEQPFQNDMYEFFECCAEKFAPAAGERDPSIRADDLWARFVRMLLCALSSHLSVAERYDKLLRKLASASTSARESIYGFVQETFGTALAWSSPTAHLMHDPAEREMEGINCGGHTRIKALLHHDLRTNNLYRTSFPLAR